MSISRKLVMDTIILILRNKLEAFPKNIIVDKKFNSEMLILSKLYNKILNNYGKHEKLMDQFLDTVQLSICKIKPKVFIGASEQFVNKYIELINLIMEDNILDRRSQIILGIKDIEDLVYKYDYYIRGEDTVTLTGHSQIVYRVKVFPDGRIVSVSVNNTRKEGVIKIWNSLTGECLNTLIGHTGLITNIELLPDGRIVSGSLDTTIRIWDGGESKFTLPVNDFVEFLCVLPDTRIVSVSNNPPKLKIWNSNTGEYESILEGHTNPITCLDNLPNGRIITGSGDNTIKIWDDKECKLTLSGHTATIKCTNILPDGQIVSGSDDKTIKIWDPITGECKTTLEGHSEPIIEIIVISDTQIISREKGRTMILWNLDTNEHELLIYDSPIICMYILPNKCVVIGFDNGTLKIYDPETHSCELFLTNYINKILCLNVLPNGKIVSGSKNGTLKI